MPSFVPGKFVSVPMFVPGLGFFFVTKTTLVSSLFHVDYFWCQVLLYFKYQQYGRSFVFLLVLLQIKPKKPNIIIIEHQTELNRNKNKHREAGALKD